MKRKSLLSGTLALAVTVTALFGGVSQVQKRDVLAAEPVVAGTYYNITNVYTGRMIDIPSGTDADNVLLHTWTINSSNAEQYTFEKVSGEDYYYIIPKVAPTRVIDNPSGSLTAGTQYQIYTKNSTDSQKFSLESDGEGNYMLINKKSGMAMTDMTDEKGSTDEEKDIAIRQQTKDSTNKRQLWKITKLANDYYFNEPIKTSGSDPSVVEAGGKYYYCYAGGTSVKITELTSFENMNSFGQIVVAYTPPTGTMYSSDVWAPELCWVNGRWYVYYAADDGTNANHRMYVLEGGTNQDNPLDGDWTFKGKIYDTTNDRWAIDGTVFTYNNENYFVWSGWDVSDGNEQNLYIAKMSDPCTLSGSRVCISKPTNSWEKSGSSAINEGPEVLISGSKVHIVYSAAGSWTDNYCLGMITCTDGNFLNASSWTKTANPVFQKTDTTYGPGHNTFVKSVDGTENWIIYHCARYSGSKWTRAIRAQRFTWTDSGYPYFGEPIDQGVSVSRPSKTYNPPVNTTDYYKLVNVGTGKVLEIKDMGDTNGTKIQTGIDIGTAGQRFKFKANADKWFTFIPKCASSKVVDNPSASKTKNTTYQIYSSNGSPSQKFRFEDMGNGQYRIVNKASLFALTDTSNISGATGLVEQRRYMNSDDQLWQLVPVSDEEEYVAPAAVTVSTDQSWTSLGAWSYYFGDWNASAGTYTGGDKADNLTLNITGNNKSQWGIQIALDNQKVTSGHEYRYTVNVSSSAAGSILSKEDISRLKEDTTAIKAGDNVITGTFVASGSTAKILLELASGINVGTTLNFTGFKLEDLTEPVTTSSAETTTTQITTTSEQTTTTESITTKEAATTTKEAETTAKETETSTSADISTDQYGQLVSNKVVLNGYQISTGKEGFRVLGSVEDTIDSKQVVKYGFIYGLNTYDDKVTGIDDSDMNIDATSEYVKAYETTSEGKTSAILGNSETAQYFVRTMKFGANNKTAYTASYKVRVYAQLSDGTYVYSKSYNFTVYSVAQTLYKNLMMNSLEQHNYLYNTILKTVDADYKEVDYNWDRTILEP